MLTLMMTTGVCQCWCGRRAVTPYKVEVRNLLVCLSYLVQSNFSLLLFLESAVRAEGKALFSGFTTRQVM